MHLPIFDSAHTRRLSPIAAVLVLGTWLTGCSSVTPAISPSKPSTSPAITGASSPSSLDNFQQKLANARHEYTLDNGLKVIIKEDHRAPVVISQIWYRVGAADEPKHLGGISHVLEHMMFKGTQKVSSADFERLIAKFGGSNNAFTSYDYTAYYEVFPANRLGLALELEADRMTHLQLRDSDFGAERQVVMEERRQRTDDNPNARAYEYFIKMAYPDNPKGESVIGPMTEIESITLQDLKDWYQTWYAPNNATLVIVGDVNPADALAQVKRYFADIPAKPLPPRPSVLQAGFRGNQTKTIRLPVQVPSVILAFNVPTLTTATDAKTAHSLSLLADILDGGLSARLEKNLVRDKQLLASVGSGYSAFSRGDGLFLIQATPQQGVSLDQAKAAILAEIEALKQQPIHPSELNRAKTNTLTGLIYGQDSLSGQAQIIGSLNSIGLDDRLIYQLPAIFDRIDQADLQAVAKKYLVANNLTVLNVVSDTSNAAKITANDPNNPTKNHSQSIQPKQTR